MVSMSEIMDFIEQKYKEKDQYFCSVQMAERLDCPANNVSSRIGQLERQGTIIKTSMKSACDSSKHRHFHYILNKKFKDQTNPIIDKQEKQEVENFRNMNKNNVMDYIKENITTPGHQLQKKIFYKFGLDYSLASISRFKREMGYRQKQSYKHFFANPEFASFMVQKRQQGMTYQDIAKAVKQKFNIQLHRTTISKIISKSSASKNLPKYVSWKSNNNKTFSSVKQAEPDNELHELQLYKLLVYKHLKKELEDDVRR